MMIEKAAAESVRRHLAATPVWLGMRPARDVVPGMDRRLILKSGPPLPWEALCSTQRQGIVNGILFEGWAVTPKEAEQLARTGEVEFAPGNDHQAVCSGAGITTPSMVVNVVCEGNSGKLGFCAPFEGRNRGGLGGWGVYSPEIGSYLRTMREVIAPAVNRLLGEGIELDPVLSLGFAMGDEMHSCQDGASSLILNELLTRLLRSGLPEEVKLAVTDFLVSSRRFFHPLDMAAAMAMTQAQKEIPFSPIVTAMVGNGVEYGIKVGAFGDRWFTAPSPEVMGIGVEQPALPWIGDSSMTETAGWGGIASGASAVAARGIGLTLAEAARVSGQMARICAARNSKFLLGGNDNAAAPCCIDIREVVRSGIAPVLHGGRISPSGERLGAGTATVPLACFRAAFDALNQLTGER